MIKKAGYIFLLYFILIIVFSFPLITSIKTHVLGKFGTLNFEGQFLMHWQYNYFISHLKLPFQTDFYFYPIGYNRFFNEGIDSYSILSIPIQKLFGFPIYYNLLLLVILTLNGLCGFWLLYYFLKDKILSFICGFIMVINPYILGELKNGELPYLSLFIMCLYILFLFKTYDEDKSINSYLLVLSFFACFFCNYFFSIFIILFTLTFLMSKLIYNFDISVKIYRKKFLVPFIFIGVILTPFFIYYLILGIRGNISINLFQNFFQFQIPKMISILISSSPNFSFPVINSKDPVFPQYISFTLLLPLPLYLYFSKNNKFWFFSALLFYMLSLGPYIKSENNVIITPNALFLFFYQWMPFFSRLLFPHRFIFLLIICIVIIYGHGLLILKEKLKNIKILYYCICFMLIFIFLTDIYIKGYLPFPMSKIEVPEFYYEISKQNDYEIIDVPFTQSPWASFYQIFHHKKLLGGMPEMAGYLYPKEYFQFVISNSFLQFLISLNNYPPIYKPFVEIDLEEIKNLRFKYLILHQSSFYPSEYYRSFTSNPEDHYEQYKKIIESFFGNPVFSDKLINVYRIF